MNVDLARVSDWLRQLSKALARYPEMIHGITVARADLEHAAAVCDSGDFDATLLQVLLACNSLTVGIRDSKQYWDRQNEIETALDTPLLVYLDTNIISAFVKNDLSQKELDALSRLLDHYRNGDINVCTSREAEQEISRIPDEHKQDRVAILRICSMVRLAKVEVQNGGIAEGLPAAIEGADRAHLAQAIQAGSPDFPLKVAALA